LRGIWAEALVEKDWFVTQAIAAIAMIDYQGFEVVFSGGTALAKAHHLLQRFSEDVDFRLLVPEALQNRKARSGYKKALVTSLRQAGFSIEESDIRARDENRFFAIDLGYESYFAKAGALRPHIQVELKAVAPQLPALSLPISSFIHALGKRLPEVTQVACIDPVESAADKLSALAWRIPDRVRGGQFDDPTIVRHSHDLALLKDKALAHPRFHELVAAAMQQDKERPKNNSSFSGMTMAEKLERMMVVLEADGEYAREYVDFVESVSYAPAGTVPDFEMALQAMRELVKALNAYG
jgi:Nucleotidyl transferase AbiEii toxin, Type IV TA system